MRFKINKNILDLILSPFTYLAAIWFRKIRANTETMHRSVRILIENGVFPVIDRYWEPMFNSAHLRYPLDLERSLPAIDLNIKEQLELLARFKFTDELLKFPMDKTDQLEFYYRNGNFGPGDAEYLYSAIRFFKPRRIVEIGSGNSTLMAINAIKGNRGEDPAYRCEHICIEPYECSWLEKLDLKILRKKVEDVDKELFLSLGVNDMLFIDSSHIIRPQGDVLLEYLELLPFLKPGVITHIHDIFTPRDYPREWIIDKVRFWNEQYLLEAFLSFNSSFKVVASLNHLKHRYFEKLSMACPILKGRPQSEPGSFYIVRK